MAEVVGLVSAIAGIVTSGFQLANAISTIVDDFGTAGAQVRAIAAETKAISLTLRQLKKHLDKAKRITADIASTINDIITECRKVIDDIKECLAPLLAKKAKKMLLKHRLRWLFTKSKVSARLASLDSLKMTLTLLIHGLDLMEEEDFENYMRVEIQQIIAESPNVKIAFVHAARIDQAFQQAFEASQTASSLKMIDQSGSETGSLLENTAELDDNSVHGIVEAAAYHNPENHNLDAGGLELALRSQLLLSPRPSVMDVLDNISDDYFMMIAEHMRLRKAVSSFALAVIHENYLAEHDDGITVLAAENDSGISLSEETSSDLEDGISQQRTYADDWVDAVSAPEASASQTAEVHFTTPSFGSFSGETATINSRSCRDRPPTPFEYSDEWKPKHREHQFARYSKSIPLPPRPSSSLSSENMRESIEIDRLRKQLVVFKAEQALEVAKVEERKIIDALEDKRRELERAKLAIEKGDRNVAKAEFEVRQAREEWERLDLDLGLLNHKAKSRLELEPQQHEAKQAPEKTVAEIMAAEAEALANEKVEVELEDDERVRLRRELMKRAGGENVGLKTISGTW